MTPTTAKTSILVYVLQSVYSPASDRTTTNTEILNSVCCEFWSEVSPQAAGACSVRVVHGGACFFPPVIHRHKHLKIHCRSWSFVLRVLVHTPKQKVKSSVPQAAVVSRIYHTGSLNVRTTVSIVQFTASLPVNLLQNCKQLRLSDLEKLHKGHLCTKMGKWMAWSLYKYRELSVNIIIIGFVKLWVGSKTERTRETANTSN